MIVRVRSAVWVMVLFFAGPGAGAAQDAPRVTLSGGWQSLWIEDETLSKGWYADVGGNLDRTFAIVGEVSRASKSLTETEVISGLQVAATASVNVDSYLGGVRFSVRSSPKIVPFGQVLTGVARVSASIDGTATTGGVTVTVSESDSSINSASMFGGGVDLFITRAIGVRVGGSYMRVVGLEGEGGVNVMRFGVGIVAAF